MTFLSKCEVTVHPLSFPLKFQTTLDAKNLFVDLVPRWVRNVSLSSKNDMCSRIRDPHMNPCISRDTYVASDFLIL